MKAALLAGIKNFTINEITTPEIIDEYDVRIRIKTVGVCGSDIHYFTTGRIGNQIVEFPFIVGHEAAGIIESVGTKVTRVKPGQRVAIDPTVGCGKCDQCLSGREHTCRKLLFLGCPKQLDGSLSQYIVINEKCCYPIIDSMTSEQATLSEPLAIGVYSVERAKLPAKANVGILGLGPIGMSVFHVIKTHNVNDVYVTDKLNYRIEHARHLNPKWAGNPNGQNIVKEILKIEPLQLDCVFECSGDPDAIQQAIELLKPGGHLVIVGITEVDEISFPIHELRRKEITIINIRRQVHCTQKAIDLLATKKVNMDAMVTHSFSIEETQKAFDLVANYEDGVMKAMILVD